MGKQGKVYLGRSLIKERSSSNRDKRYVKDKSMLHTQEINNSNEWERLKLQSITAPSCLYEFLSIAELAGQDFVVGREDYYACLKEAGIMHGYDDDGNQPEINYEPLTIPRRPPWAPEVTAEEQQNKERESFLEWRRYLNIIQRNILIPLSPYERNIKFWKHLWIVLEKADIVMIILDARSPLVLRCEDLEKYALELKCKCILLLNKADLITEYERKCWAKYFDKENTPIVFFSVHKNTDDNIMRKENDYDINKSQKCDSDAEIDTPSDDSTKKDLKSTDKDIETFKQQLGELDKAISLSADKLYRIEEILDKVVANLRLGKPVEPYLNNENIEANNVSEKSAETIKVTNSSKIFNRTMLEDMLKRQDIPTLKHPPRLRVGMIGYPNVGKSSVVNVLTQSNKMSVSAMPGHTRNIQNLLLDDELELLDCPGLVLPAYAVAPDLLLTAVLPIDQMQSHDAAMARLCTLVGKHTFEEVYGLRLPKTKDSHADYRQLLNAHAYNRGFMTAAGQPDQSRSARQFLKDAASGRLKWAVLPPGCAPAPLAEMIKEKKISDKRQPTPREARMVEGWLNKTDAVDKSFYTLHKSGALMKGTITPGVTGRLPAGPQPKCAQVSKPWKQERKHENKNRKEKLRRVYHHLDEH